MLTKQSEFYKCLMRFPGINYFVIEYSGKWYALTQIEKGKVHFAFSDPYMLTLHFHEHIDDENSFHIDLQTYNIAKLMEYVKPKEDDAKKEVKIFFKELIGGVQKAHEVYNEYNSEVRIMLHDAKGSLLKDRNGDFMRLTTIFPGPFYGSTDTYGDQVYTQGSYVIYKLRQI